MAMKTCPKCEGENNEDVTGCVHCHADLPGTPSNIAIAALQAPPPPIISQDKQMVVEPITNGLASAALYLGIASIIFSVLTGIVGLILGVISVVQIKCSGGRQIGMGMAIAGIIASIILPLISSDFYFRILTNGNHSRARQVGCVRNQQQIATLVTIYAQEHSGNFPNDDFFGALKADPRVLECPEGVGIGYGYNGNLRGVNSAKVINPVGTLLLSEGEGKPFTKSDDIDKTRHAYMFNVCFVDGHMEKYAPQYPVTLDVHLKQ